MVAMGYGLDGYAIPGDDDLLADAAGAHQGDGFGEADLSLLVAWSLTQTRCACCWIGQREAAFHRWPGLQTHHLVKRSRRVCHEPWNLLRLCERCHRLAEGERVRGSDGQLLPVLTFGHTLWLKCAADPMAFRPDELRRSYGRGLPEMLPVPAVFVRERQRWRPVMDWRDVA